jgi:hypothetical protein
MRALTAVRAVASATALACGVALAVPPTPEEITRICTSADGAAHCARLVEAEQMKRLPNLARRDGDTLFIKLYPNGEAKFEDRHTLQGGTTYALFDFVNEFNAAVVWVTKDEGFSLVLLQRVNGRQTPIPAQPAPSPDRTRFATADFCATHCENQLVVWVVDKEGVRRDVAWKPPEKWADATVQWKGDDTLVLDYTRDGDGAPRKLERKLSEPGWTKAAAQ